MSDKTYDLIVIGGGPGGHAAAVEAARRGARVGIVERARWGGTCTHRGCVPTKALLTCSGHFAGLKKMGRLGITTGETGYDFQAIRRHRDQIVRVSALGVEKSLQEAGVQMKAGTGKIVSPGAVAWTDEAGKTEVLAARHIVIAWGSEPARPPFPITAATGPARVLTSDTFLQLTALPKSVVIIGGSVIGVEFATFLAELGVPVRIVEILPALLPYEEEEAAALLLKELTRSGVKVLTAARVESLREEEEGVRIVAARDGGETELTADYALICTGRRPRLDEEELTALGIPYGRGGIAVDGELRTGVAGIYAVGDVTGGVMLAHRAMQQGRSLASRLFGDGSVVCRDEAVPAVTYSHPPIARVGLTERQARERGWSVDIVRNDYGANIMARAELTPLGFAKFIFHAGRLVGATVAGAGAPDLIAPLGLALAAGADLKTLNDWIIPHPTLSEVLGVGRT